MTASADSEPPIWILDEDWGNGGSIELTVEVTQVPNLAYSVKVMGNSSPSSHISVPPDTGPIRRLVATRTVVRDSTG